MSIVLCTSDWIRNFADDYVASRTPLHLLSRDDVRAADSARAQRRLYTRDARMIARNAETD